MSHDKFPWLLVTRGFFSRMRVFCRVSRIPAPLPRGLTILLKPCGLCRLRGGVGKGSAPALLSGSSPGSVCWALKDLHPRTFSQGSCCERLHLTEGSVGVRGCSGCPRLRQS